VNGLPLSHPVRTRPRRAARRTRVRLRACAIARAPRRRRSRCPADVCVADGRATPPTADALLRVDEGMCISSASAASARGRRVKRARCSRSETFSAILVAASLMVSSGARSTARACRRRGSARRAAVRVFVDDQYASPRAAAAARCTGSIGLSSAPLRARHPVEGEQDESGGEEGVHRRAVRFRAVSHGASCAYYRGRSRDSL